VEEKEFPDRCSPRETALTADDSLFDLAQQIRGGSQDNPRQFRATLEASLVPVIRRALRTGTGHPSLLRWVRAQLATAAERSSDPSRAAAPMARLLCERLLARIDPLPGRETLAS
jgi:hypothetical protein